MNLAEWVMGIATIAGIILIFVMLGYFIKRWRELGDEDEEE